MSKLIKKACDGLYYGPAPSKKTISLDDIHKVCTVIVNCREVTSTSHWYFPSSGEKTDETIYAVEDGEVTNEQHRFIAHPTPDKKVANPKDVQNVCEKIVRAIQHDKQSVYVHCFDGTSTCGVVVMLCLYWLNGGKQFDPFEEMRKGKSEFLLCDLKVQQTQVKSLYSFVNNRIYWGSQLVEPKKKKRR